MLLYSAQVNRFLSSSAQSSATHSLVNEISESAPSSQSA